VLGEAGDPFEPTQTVLQLGQSTIRVIGPKIPILRPVRSARTEMGHEPVTPNADPAAEEREAFRAVEHVRRMLGPVAPAEGSSLARYPATALQSFVNCERQFYYTRLLRLPGSDGGRSGRDLAERADAAGRMPASLRGLVIHRFCETYLPDDEPDDRLRRSLRDVRAARGDAFADVFAALDEEVALDDLRPLARNYLASPMRLRVEERLAAGERLPNGQHEFVLSELAFTLRVPEGFIHGTIDKVLLTPLPSGRVRATVVDFKTGAVRRGGLGLAAAVERAAAEHRLQMQIYAHAVRRLVRSVSVVEATLHFLEPGPGVEYDVAADAIAEARAAKEIDRVLTEIARGRFDPVMFEARPARRCRTCAFAGVCPEGAAHLATETLAADA
jgi:CRISPR/Cas system-associated exonuclease Cas4 (RecB family)